jgi:hypothetical protein
MNFFGLFNRKTVVFDIPQKQIYIKLLLKQVSDEKFFKLSKKALLNVLFCFYEIDFCQK